MKNLFDCQLAKLLHLLSFISAIAFGLMFGILSYFNRFAADDYSMIGLANHKGILGTAVYFYYNWSGGFFGILFQTFTVFVMQQFNSLFIYGSFLFLLSGVSLFFLIYEIVSLCQYKLSKTQIFLISQLFIQVVFFSGFSIDQNWFWVVGSTGYIYPLCIIFFSAGFIILYKRKSQPIFLAIGIFCGFCLGSYSVNYVLLYFFMYNIYVLYKYYTQRSLPLFLVLYWCFLLLGLAINITAPGNYVRMARATSAIVIPVSFIDQITHHPIIILKKLLAPYNVALMLMFGFPIIALSTLSYLKIGFPYSRRTIVKAAIVIYCFLGITVLSYILINYKALGWGLGSPRSMMPISIFFMLSAIISLLFLFDVFKYNRILIAMSCLALLVCIYRSVSILVRQYPVVKYYAAKHDERTQLILQKKVSYKAPILYLDSLPSAGILCSAEIGKDTLNYINEDMKMRFDLPFAIAVK